MNILAFNSSPRDHQTSKTELVLQKFLEGARRAGAVTETLYLQNYKINQCLSCFCCWLKTPGRCVQKDDMAETLFDRYLQADVVVLATPIYCATMNARMKVFVERTLPMMDPLGEMPEGKGGHPHRFEKMPRVVALSVASYWDQAIFQALSLTWRMCLGRDLIAEIYRNSSEFLGMPEFQVAVRAVLDAVARAGEEVVRQGMVNPDTMAALTQPLAPAESFDKVAGEGDSAVGRLLLQGRKQAAGSIFQKIS
ncbi:MAG: flavodoxin family protein [Deltaproteobacteria bacterium]|nr:flavodoxin family protein [Deltaproteobacteria bacterium]